MFRPLGTTVVADDAPPTLTELESFRRAGRLWVPVADGRTSGYATAEVVGCTAHLGQVSVDPRWATAG